MARIDPLLKALCDRNASEMILEDGQQPAFAMPDGTTKAVSPKVLAHLQIVALLAEVATPPNVAKLRNGAPFRFAYTLAGSGCFDFSFEGQGVFRVLVRPQATPAAIETLVPVTAEAVVPDRPAVATPAVAAPAIVAPAIATAAVAAPAIDETTDQGRMERYMRRMVAIDASDLHLSAGETPMVRVHGEIVRLDDEPRLDGERTRVLLDSIMPERNREEFAACSDTDFAYEIPGVSRFRVNVFADRKGVGGVFRTIPTEILTAEQLGLPAAVLNMCNLSKGLVLVTGPTGSGKSTTLAAMVDYINKTRSDHIITIEDPIEFVHPNQRCLVNQREISTHTSGFKRALRAALREDPDIVLVGELRDLETIAIAIETAETGHLVFGTLHTTTAISTVDRVIDQFPADRQAQIRVMLSESLRGVVAQTLLKKAGGGRVAALEVLVVNPAISNLIRESKTFQIASLMQTGKKLGMQLLNDVLLDLVRTKTVEPDEAYRKAVDKASFRSMCEKHRIQVTAASKTN